MSWFLFIFLLQKQVQSLQINVNRILDSPLTLLLTTIPLKFEFSKSLIFFLHEICATLMA